MDHFYIIANKNKKSAEKLQHKICEFLEAAGKTVTVAAEKAERGHIAPDGCECILVLGGDGTMLNAADDNAEGQIPLLGINLGTMGYLAEIEKDAWKEALTRLLDGNFEIEERMMLEGTIMHENPGMPAEPNSHLALNEVVLFRSPSGAASHFRVLVNGAFLNEYKADGIIISTPTGSTAYNLGAGGPIVDPAARMTILTPICAHALNRSSIVLRAEDTIEVVVSSDQEGIQSVSFDGAVTKELRAGSRVRVTGSDLRTPLIRLSGGTFFTQLRSKMTVL